MNKLELALNNQQWLICHKTKPFVEEKTTHPMKQSENVYAWRAE